MFRAITIIALISLSIVYGDKYHKFEDDLEATTKSARNFDHEDKEFWNAVAQDELQDALNNKLNTNVAKNVILFLGDGMGVPTVTAARIYVGQGKGKSGEEGFLSFEKFPHVGLSKTFNVDHTVPDSAGTGTAYLCGVKTNRGVIGVDARVKRSECETMSEDSIVDSIAKWAQDGGKRTGFVTSTRVTHATPANLYAHVPERDWECDDYVPHDCQNVKDIAKQLIEDKPGRDFNVIMGGGLQELDGEATDKPWDHVDDDECIRKDGRRLWKEWLKSKSEDGKVARFVTDLSSLQNVDTNSTEYLMGIFANSHLPYEYRKIEHNLDIPTLKEMVEKAIQVLQSGDNGFFLLVEGGRIDHGHHGSRARRALDETAAMDDAILKALELTNEEDTLIVVTADHSHTMMINGYPRRGNPILEFAGEGSDDLPYTTLSYGNGPGFDFTVEDDEVARIDLTDVDVTSFKYRQASAVPRHSETHGGEDVAIYAKGPMAHLFHSVHEQNYIAHAMAYAACIGPNLREDC